MVHIRGDIHQVAEVLKIAYTEKVNALQNAERWLIQVAVPPGGIAYTRLINRGKTGVVKLFDVSANNVATLLPVTLRRDGGNIGIFGSYFFNRQNWEINDAIIPAGDQLIVNLENPTGANIDYTVQVLIVDAEGTLT